MKSLLPPHWTSDGHLYLSNYLLENDYVSFSFLLIHGSKSHSVILSFTLNVHVTFPGGRGVGGGGGACFCMCWCGVRIGVE